MNRCRFLSSDCFIYLLKYSFKFLLTCAGEAGVARRNFDREATKRATRGSPIRAKEARDLPVSFVVLSLTCAGDVAKIRRSVPGDVARSRKLTDLGLLKQEITKSTAKNDRGRNIDIF